MQPSATASSNILGSLSWDLHQDEWQGREILGTVNEIVLLVWKFIVHYKPVFICLAQPSGAQGQRYLLFPKTQLLQKVHLHISCPQRHTGLKVAEGVDAAKDLPHLLRNCFGYKLETTVPRYVSE